MYRCGRERFPCRTHCDESFLTMYNRKHHLENLDSTTCKECGKEFKGWRGVERHMKQLHSEKKAEIECEHCRRQFKETYIKRHIKLLHSNEKVLEATYEKGARFECNTCEGVFDRNTNLQNHMKKHSSKNANNNLRCGNCLIYLASKASLKRHIRIRHKEWL